MLRFRHFLIKHTKQLNALAVVQRELAKRGYRLGRGIIMTGRTGARVTIAALVITPTPDSYPKRPYQRRPLVNNQVNR